MSIENLKKLLESERELLSKQYRDEAFKANPNGYSVTPGCNEPDTDFELGHEAATNRLLPMLQKAVEMAELISCKSIYVGENGWKDEHFSDVKQAEEFLSEFTKMTDIKNDDLKSEITKLKEENEKLENEFQKERQLHKLNVSILEKKDNEVTILKEENERLNSYVILGYETVHKESLEEITRLIEENEKLKFQSSIFNDTLKQNRDLTTKLSLEQQDRESEKRTYKTRIEAADGYIAELKKSHEVLKEALYLKQLSAKIHEVNVKAGWWTDLATGEPLDRNVGELLCLVHSEISEAMEAYRKDLNDDKLPHRKGFEVELADALIRIFDIAGKFMLDLDGAIEEKMAYNAKRADHKLDNRQGANGKKF